MWAIGQDNVTIILALTVVTLHVGKEFFTVGDGGITGALVQCGESTIRWLRSKRMAVSVTHFRFAIIMLGKDASLTSIKSYKSVTSVIA